MEKNNDFILFLNRYLKIILFDKSSSTGTWPISGPYWKQWYSEYPRSREQNVTPEPLFASSSFCKLMFDRKCLSWILNEIIGPPPIRHLHVEAPTNNATVLHIHWTMPADNGCSSDEYVVEYRQENLDQCEETSLLPGQTNRLTLAGVTTMTHLVVAALQPYSSYTVFVSARNQFGRSRKVNSTKRTSETGRPMSRVKVGGVLCVVL